jgi:hypothetical protein
MNTTIAYLYPQREDNLIRVKNQPVSLDFISGVTAK